jgi:RNA polymerase sigma-70 factor (ECF subfamily)
LHDTLATTMTDAFPFMGARCDRVTETVMQRLQAMAPDSPAG